jgi:hypothetical protein
MLFALAEVAEVLLVVLALHQVLKAEAQEVTLVLEQVAVQQSFKDGFHLLQQW